MGTVENRYAAIIVPKTYLREKGTDELATEDAIINVTPITDRYISSPIRTPEEVNQIIEARLQILSDGFKNPHSSISRSYGVENTIDSSLARLLAFVDLIDEQRVAKGMNQTLSQNAKSSYQKDKTEINSSPRTKGNKRKAIDESWKKKYNPAIIHHEQRVREADAVENLIFRKVVLEIFSSEPQGNGKGISIDSLTRLIDHARSLFDANSHSGTKHEAFKAREPIEYFVDAVSEYMATTKDPEVFKRCKYKAGAIVRTKEESKFIDYSLTSMFDPGIFTGDIQTQRLLEKFGRSYLTLLKNRAKYNALNPAREVTPYLTLIYDFLTSPLYRNSFKVLNKASTFIDEFFADFKGSKHLRNEIRETVYAFHRKGFEAVDIPAEVLKRFPNQVGNIDFSFSIPEVQEEFAKHGADYLNSDEIQLITGFLSLQRENERLFPNGLPLPCPDIIKWINRTTFEVVGNLAKKITPEERNKLAFLAKGTSNIIRPLETNPDVPPLTTLSSYTTEVGNFIKPRTTEYMESDLLQQTLLHHRRLNELEGSDIKTKMAYLKERMQGYLSDTSPGTYIDTDLITTYLKLFFQEAAQSEHFDSENEFLWREVYDNTKWFLSPRGDRFKQTNDPQLAEYGIDSLIFYPDRNYPRENKVIIKLTDIDRQLELWIDTQRNLLLSNRNTITIEPKAQSAFLNIILKRLYTITSGLLSTPPKFTGIEPRDGKTIEYRRAFYRLLTSTASHPISLESLSAQMHAAEIKQDYGIDIYHENARRKSSAVGTLSENEFITFVREVVPEEIRYYVMPNDLIYDPTSIQIPVI